MTHIFLRTDALQNTFFLIRNALSLMSSMLPDSKMMYTPYFVVVNEMEQSENYASINRAISSDITSQGNHNYMYIGYQCAETNVGRFIELVELFYYMELN